MASLIAVAQADIKRILAYSTVSQLGLMMVSLGVGGVAAGIMHLLAHGFFKALLFLGAGSVIHGCHHEQDIRKMGGLRQRMPMTFLTYAVGMMALSGAPLFFSGAWTKEEVLHATGHWASSSAPYYLMMLGVILTAFYMTRQMAYVFFGKHRGHHAPHESPPIMTMPLMILAVCAVLLGFIGTPFWPWFQRLLTGEQHAFHPAIFWGFDVDSVRSADAPGVSAPSPIGFTSEEFCDLARLAGERANTRIIEFTEVNPTLDVDNRTSKLVAFAIHEFLRASVSSEHG